MQLIDQADKFTIWGARFIRQASLAVFTGLIYNERANAMVNFGLIIDYIDARDDWFPLIANLEDG